MTKRSVENAEALEWLARNAAPEGACVVTSMPDVSEVPLDFAEWREWFIRAARTIVRWIPRDGVAIFFQSDIRERGTHVDKGYLVMRGVSSARIATIGYGEQYPKADNATEEGRALNRRVEIRITPVTQEEAAAARR